MFVYVCMIVSVSVVCMRACVCVCMCACVYVYVCVCQRDGVMWSPVNKMLPGMAWTCSHNVRLENPMHRYQFLPINPILIGEN